MRFLQATLLLIFLALIAVFAWQNTQPVTIRFLDRSVGMPIALMVIVVYLLGMLSGWTVVAYLRRSIHDVSSQPRT
jgi:lipopolysaccharide assembly protein A